MFERVSAKPHAEPGFRCYAAPTLSTTMDAPQAAEASIRPRQAVRTAPVPKHAAWPLACLCALQIPPAIGRASPPLSAPTVARASSPARLPCSRECLALSAMPGAAPAAPLRRRLQWPWRSSRCPFIRPGRSRSMRCRRLTLTNPVALNLALLRRLGRWRRLSPPTLAGVENCVQ